MKGEPVITYAGIVSFGFTSLKYDIFEKCFFDSYLGDPPVYESEIQEQSIRNNRY